MKAIIHNSRFISTFSLNGNKSIAQRALLASFLANSITVIENFNKCDDTIAILNFLNAINKKVVFLDETSLYILPSENKHFDILEIDVLNSAAALRFLLPLALNFANKVIFHCKKDLINRPLDIYYELTSLCNLSIKKEGNDIIASGIISLDYFEIKGNISSQFISGLMINALYLKKATTIKVIPPFESKSYINLTIDVFSKFGFYIKEIEENTYLIDNAFINSNNDFFIEGDYGLASNLIVLASLNGQVEITNLKENSNQPDYQIVNLIKSIGGNIYFDNDKLSCLNLSLLTKGFPKRLKAFEIDVKECIDLAPILMVLASFTNGKSKIYNVERLKIKESNRLDNMLTSLKKLGVDITYSNNVITIIGKNEYNNNDIILDSFNDHRIVMALSIFALLNHGCICLDNINCVNKSAPNFFELLNKGIKNNAIEII